MNPGDLGQNAYRLLEVVLKAPPSSRFVDIGVLDGTSSEIMLVSAGPKNNRVWGIDASECPPQLRNHPNYEFLRGDSVTELSRWTEGKIYLAFFDTLHIAEQVMCELYYAWPWISVGGYAVFHDTEWPKYKFDHYLGREWDRPEVGVERFFKSIESEVIIQHHPVDYGMTFVERLSDADPRRNIDWGPIFNARNQLLSLLDPFPLNQQRLNPTLP
jgi:cephalosporin hydroxylase